MRDNACFKYLVHWKGFPNGGATYRVEDDMKNLESIVAALSSRDLSKIFSGSMVQGTIAFMQKKVLSVSI